MSEIDYVEPSSDSFWEIGQYKRTIKRCEDGYKLCTDLVQMIAERADIEKAYAKSLKVWSRKWTDYLQQKGGAEYGSMKTTYLAALNEADKVAEIHLATHNVLNDELSREIKEWQKQSYPKSIVNQLKTPKEYEEEFKKAQKPWGKKYAAVEKAKKDYHSACKSWQSAKVQLANSQSDPSVSPEQKKKLEDKVEKAKKECEVTKSKYRQALDELNAYNSRYIEDMKNVYAKCDQFEHERLDFFVQKFIKLHSHLNIYEKTNVDDIYAEFLRTVKQTNADKDLQGWSKEFGCGMPMSWPVFEEYSEELKTIARGARASKLVRAADGNPHDGGGPGGITMTSIKHHHDLAPATSNEAAAAAADNKSLASSNAPHSSNDKNASNHYSNSNNSKDSNPFGDDEDDESPTTTANANNLSSKNPNTFSNDDSDDEKPNPATYLSIKVKALYDYHSAEDDELSFKAGEEFIKLAHEDDRGWCLGKIGTKVGLYPATYADEI